MAIADERSFGEEKYRSPKQKLGALAARHGHLRRHLLDFREEKGYYPELVDKPRKNEQYLRYGREKRDILYRTEGILFAHLHKGRKEAGNRYYVIEPSLDGEEQNLYERIREEIFDRTLSNPVPEESDLETRLKKLFDELVSIGDGGRSMFDALKGKKSERFSLPGRVHDKILYRLKRDIAGLGPLEPLLKDRTNEDVHVVSPEEVHVNNKIYGMMETNVDLGAESEYKRWLRAMTERIGDPVSDATPLVDSSLPDGSRLNVIYSDDVSIEGPTLTIRQFEETPLSVIQIVKFGTMSPELAAYLWLCVEANTSMAVCGETAAGKTTTLNAMTVFIPEDHKIVSAEDTLEIKVPHEAWQRLLTREGEGEETEVTLFDLVTASLRARPDNLIIGEVRGAEAFNVFQAMQTGHPTLFTFHAGNIVALVNRFTGEPLNVPERYFENLNVAIFQNFIKKKEMEMRRVTSVQEIEGYSKRMDGIVTRRVFDWDPVRDKTRFLGRYNSYVLEEKVAGFLGLADPRDIYDELERRARLIEGALAERIFGYGDIIDLFGTYRRGGLDAVDWDRYSS